MENVSLKLLVLALLVKNGHEPCNNIEYPMKLSKTLQKFVRASYGLHHV